MIRSRLAGGILVGMAALMLLAPVQADLAGDLGSLKTVVTNLLAGDTLDKKQEKAVAAILKTIEKAEAVQDDAPKYLKKIGKVLLKVDKAVAKGVSLTNEADAILAALIAVVEAEKGDAVVLRDLLVSDKNEKKVAAGVVRGDMKVTAAKTKATTGKKAKVYAKAAVKFMQTSALGRKYRQKEIDQGLVTFNVLSTSIDANTTLMPGQFITITFDLPVDAGRLQVPVVELLDAGGNTVSFGTRPAPTGEGKVVELDPTPEPGSYTLTIYGLDSSIGDALPSLDGVPLQTSVTRTFTIEDM